MRTTRLTAAAAAFVVTGAAFASASSDNGPGTTSTVKPSSLMTDMTYNLSAPKDDDVLSLLSTTPANQPITAAGSGYQAHLDNLGTIWALTDLSYELPGTGTTVELGFGWYGVGGGLNFYPQGGRSGLMFSARAGWSGGGGVAVNGAVNYVGHFSPNLVWRLGVGVEYQSNSGWFNGWSNVFPIGIADIGFRL